MLEGTFKSVIFEKSLSISEDTLFDLYAHQKAKELCALIKTGLYPWINESLYALEKSNEREGNNALHMAIDIGNRHLFCYLITMLKIRDQMRSIDKIKYCDSFNSFNNILEFKNRNENTPLLYSAKRN